MKALLVTTMFALAAALDVCPAGEEVCSLSFYESPAMMEDVSHNVIRTAEGAYVCRIVVTVRAAEGKMPDASKFSVRAEWKEKRKLHSVRQDASEWASQVSVKMDAPRLRWQKENPDWADGVEIFEISFPVAIPKERVVCSSGSLSVSVYYDGVDISCFGPDMWVSDSAVD